MLDKPWISGIPLKKERYKPVTNCTFWPVLWSFNNWNIIQLSQNSTLYDKFDEIHQVVLDGISDNVASLVQCGKYGSIKTTDVAANGFMLSCSYQKHMFLSFGLGHRDQIACSLLGGFSKPRTAATRSLDSVLCSILSRLLHSAPLDPLALLSVFRASSPSMSVPNSDSDYVSASLALAFSQSMPV